MFGTTRHPPPTARCAPFALWFTSCNGNSLIAGRRLVPLPGFELSRWVLARERSGPLSPQTLGFHLGVASLTNAHERSQPCATVPRLSQDRSMNACIRAAGRPGYHAACGIRRSKCRQPDRKLEHRLTREAIVRITSGDRPAGGRQRALRSAYGSVQPVGNELGRREAAC
jgi:hypothetical protein